MTCRGFLYIFPVNKSNDCPNWWTSPKTLRTTGLTTGQYPQRAHNGCALRCDWNGVGMLKFWGETNRPSRKQIWMKAGAKSRVMQFGQLPFCATVTDHKKTMAKTGPIDLVGAICYRFSVLNRHPSIWCKCSQSFESSESIETPREGRNVLEETHDSISEYQGPRSSRISSFLAINHFKNTYMTCHLCKFSIKSSRIIYL